MIKLCNEENNIFHFTLQLFAPRADRSPQQASECWILLHIAAYCCISCTGNPNIIESKNNIFLLSLNYATEKIIHFISLRNSLRQEQTGPPSKPQNAGYCCILLYIARYPAQATSISSRLKLLFSCCD